MFIPLVYFPLLIAIKQKTYIPVSKATMLSHGFFCLFVLPSLLHSAAVVGDRHQ